MKTKAILLLCLFAITVQAQTLSKADIYFNKLADKIFLAEGGTHTRFAYGIKIKVKDPRATCIKICKDAWSDYCLLGCKGDWIDYLGSIYAPTENATDDPNHLNKNWPVNVRALMAK
jgi:hypothetical protein